jgi:hypothetical protein
MESIAQPQHEAEPAVEFPAADSLATKSANPEPPVEAVPIEPVNPLEAQPEAEAPAELSTPPEPKEAPEVIRLTLKPRVEPQPEPESEREPEREPEPPSPVAEPTSEPERYASTFREHDENDEPEPEPAPAYRSRIDDDRPPSPQQPQPAAVPVRVPMSGMAIASVFFGILGFTVLPFFGAIAALIFGHAARRRIAHARGGLDGSSIAQTGIKMGYWSFFLSLFVIMVGLAWVIVTAPPRPSRAELQASLSNAHQIALACQAYAGDHNGAFPATLTDLTPKYISDPAIFICPMTGPSEPIGYEYYGGRDSDPPSNVLLMSKAQKRNRRVVARVDSTSEVVRGMPELPAGKAEGNSNQ